MSIAAQDPGAEAAVRAFRSYAADRHAGGGGASVSGVRRRKGLRAAAVHFGNCIGITAAAAFGIASVRIAAVATVTAIATGTTATRSAFSITA